MLLDGPKNALNQVILTLESSVKLYHPSCFSHKCSVVPRPMVCACRKVDEKTGSARKDLFFITLHINDYSCVTGPSSSSMPRESCKSRWLHLGRIWKSDSR